ncbi:beta strand repeat-containing protein [Dehalogenimonas etheniformans]|nr:InlB B-repeat-containing protein [Dehalogenimonas etheniformans]QNT76193.1 InlB B-repeat-containing protein [Dehalogenimonas etheniformans]
MFAQRCPKIFRILTLFIILFLFTGTLFQTATHEIAQISSFTLTYTAGPNGSITGTTPQTVAQGGSGTAVTATPAAGYHFVSWSDSVLTATRTDTNVQADVSVTATFAINTYTVTFVEGDHGTRTGGGALVQTVSHGAGATAPTITPAPGWTFTGWDVPFNNVTSDLTVNAQYSQITFTLTYTAGPNGSITGTTPQTVAQGGSGTAVTATPAAGYHFVSWSDSVLTATRTDTNVQADVSVTATFAINTYTVTFVEGDHGTRTGGGALVQTVSHGAGATAPTITPAPGWTFTGWDVPFNNVTSDLTVNAQYSQITFTLTYTAGPNGSITGTTPQTVAQGGSGTAVTATPAAGYHFVSWSDSVLTATRTDTNVQADVSVTATFAINTYTVTFVEGDHGTRTGGGALVQTVSHGAGATAPTITPAPGWTFTGWDTAFNNVTSDLTITAQYSQDAYTLTLNIVGSGSIAKSPDQPTYSYGTVVTLTPTPTAGWSFGAFSGDTTTNTITMDGNKSVTATFTVNSYTITFNSDGGSTVDPITAAYGSALSPPTPPTKTGWTFTGWIPAFPATMPLGGASLTAQWTQVTYQVTFDLGAHGTHTGGGTLIQTVAHGAAAVAPTFTTEAGWNFTGWDTAFNNVTSDLTITAQYSQDAYTLTLNIVGSGSIAKSPDQPTYSYGTVVTLTPTPTAGWSFGAFSGDTTTNTITMDGNKSVTATFTVNSYTITFNSDGGSTVDPITAAYGSALSPPTPPTKTGWTFTGWIPAFPATMPLGGASLTAQWTQVTYQVTFDLGAHGTHTGGGTLIQTVAHGAAAVAPTFTTEAGWNFTGWDTAFNNVTSDLTITAQYSQDAYTLTLNIVGSGSIAKSPDQPTYSYGTVVTLTPTPTAGWSFGAFSGDTTTNTITMDGNKSVTATFTVNSYTITFNSDGGSTVDPITAAYGSALSPPTPPTKTGWTFTGWIPAFPATMPLGGASLTAQWTQVTYQVTFDLGAHGTHTGGGTLIQTVAHGAAAVAPTFTTEAGWNFTGWDTAFNNVTSDLTITAQYSQDAYTLTLNIVGSGSIAKSPDQPTYSYGTVVTLTPTPTAGWSFGAFSGDTTTNTITMDGNKSVTATFTVNSYTITFNSDGGSTVDPITAAYGSALSPPTPPTKTGWTFTGWIPAFPATMPLGGASLTAQWTQVTYQVTFDLGAHGTHTGGGTLIQTVAHGAAAVAPTFTTEAGWNFTGWDTAFNNVTSDLTITAQYSQDAYTLTLNIVGSGSIAKSPDQPTYSYGTVVTLTPTPTAGWSFGAFSGDTTTNTITMDGNKSVTATFTFNSYTINFDSAGGSPVVPITQEFGTAIIPPANPTRTGYTFDGWSPTVPATMPASNITCVAQWTAINYTVSFNSQGGSTVANASVAFGATVTQPTDPTWTGYTFGGWFKEAACTTAWNFTSDTITGNTTLYAKWTINQYTITFNSDGGSTVSPITQDYGTAVVAPANPTKSGYTFNGWIPLVPATMPASNTTCVAQWTVSGGGGGGGGGGFGSQLIGINLSGTSPFMDPNGRSIVAGELKTSDGKLTIIVPVGVYIWNAAGAAQSFLSAAPLTNPPSAPPQNSLVMAFELGPNGVTFNPVVTLSFNYSDSDIPAGARETDLYIAWWNGTQWVKLVGTVDATANTVSAQITHFTSFALIVQQAPATTPPPTTIPPTTNPPTTSPPTTNPPTTNPPTIPVPTQSEPTETLPGSNPTSAKWIIPLLFLLASTTLGVILFWRSRKPEAELKYTNRK